MRRQETGRGIKVTGDADPEANEPRNINTWEGPSIWLYAQATARRPLGRGRGAAPGSKRISSSRSGAGGNGGDPPPASKEGGAFRPA